MRFGHSVRSYSKANEDTCFCANHASIRITVIMAKAKKNNHGDEINSLERFQNTLSLICTLPSSLKERDIENNTFNSYANK